MPDTPAGILADEQLKKLSDAGWRQGALLRVSDDILEYCVGLSAGDLAIVCTQSCSLLNPSLGKFPNVEVMAASRLPDGKYKANDDLARGKVVNELHLRLDQPANGAISIDLNRRYFVPRDLLLKRVPAEESVSARLVPALAAWIARSYTRVALPDALVVRLKPLVERIGNVLKRKRASGARLSEHAKEIFVKWTPDSELLTAKSTKSIS